MSNRPRKDKVHWRRREGYLSTWYAELHGVTVAEASLTGRYGSDDYPWDWSVVVPAPQARKVTGVTATLREAKEYVEALVPYMVLS